MVTWSVPPCTNQKSSNGKEEGRKDVELREEEKEKEKEGAKEEGRGIQNWENVVCFFMPLEIRGRKMHVSERDSVGTRVIYIHS